MATSDRPSTVCCRRNCCAERRFIERSRWLLLRCRPTAYGLHGLHGRTQATIEKVPQSLITLDAFLAQFSRAFVDQREISTRSIEAKGVVGRVLLHLRGQTEELVENLFAAALAIVGVAVGDLRHQVLQLRFHALQ